MRAWNVSETERARLMAVVEEMPARASKSTAAARQFVRRDLVEIVGTVSSVATAVAVFGKLRADEHCDAEAAETDHRLRRHEQHIKRLLGRVRAVAEKQR